jgi:hypothetical protein
MIACNFKVPKSFEDVFGETITEMQNLQEKRLQSIPTDQRAPLLFFGHTVSEWMNKLTYSVKTFPNSWVEKGKYIMIILLYINTIIFFLDTYRLATEVGKAKVAASFDLHGGIDDSKGT